MFSASVCSEYIGDLAGAFLRFFDWTSYVDPNDGLRVSTVLPPATVG